jgi:SAM-dependent methyltransferase
VTTENLAPKVPRVHKSAECFWKKRLAEYGHTGWADPFIYAFDQLERLSLLCPILTAENPRGKLALDFGCGTGDFSQLLIRAGYQVCGYDPFVRPAIQSPRFCYAQSPSSIPFEPGSLDLVVCVTVLAHITDEPALRQVLALLRHLLKDDGRMVMIEYAVDEVSTRHDNQNDYQIFRSFNEWKALFAQHDFTLRNVKPLPSPVFSPSVGYRRYSRNLIVRTLRRIAFRRAGLRIRDYILRNIATSIIRRYPVRDSQHLDSPLKIMECKPGRTDTGACPSIPG